MDYGSLTYFFIMFGVIAFMMGMVFNEILRIRSKRKEYEKKKKEETLDRIEAELNEARSYLFQVSDKLHLPKPIL
jgi:large-conductance mechanosensitive channel